MSDLSDTTTVSSVRQVGKSFPCSWDELTFTSPELSELESFDEDQLVKEVQTEYWWVRNTCVCTGSDPNSNFKAAWLKSTSQAHRDESRIEMSEYQVLRECIWALLGAGRGFLFGYSNDPKILTKNFCRYLHKLACLTHLTYKALDSFCVEIAKYSTYILQIRAFTDFVLLSAPGTVSLPFIRLAETCAQLKKDAFSAFASIELDAKLPERTFPLTLINLHNKLQPWFRRLSFMAALILHVCSPQLATITSEVTSVLLLNRLEELSNTLSHRLSDSYLANLVNSAYVSASEAYISDLMSIYNRLSTVPFLRYDSNFPPSHSRFWLSGITLCEANVPRVILPIIEEIVVGVKSMTLLQSIISASKNPQETEIGKQKEPYDTRSPELSDCDQLDFVLEFEFDDVELRELSRAMRSKALKKPSSLHLPAHKLQEKSPDRELRLMREKMRLESQRVSSYLCMRLLRGPLDLRDYLEVDPVNNDFHLMHTLTGLSNVAFFRAGDRMDLFCQSFFSINPDKRTEIELNRILRKQISFICGEKSWLCERIRVGFDSQSGVPVNNGLLATNALTLCIDVPWPLNIVLIEESIAVYQRVFKFLLAVRHLLESLC